MSQCHSLLCRYPAAVLLFMCSWLAVGCAPAILTVDDAILRPNQKAEFVAYVEREAAFSLRKDVEGAKVAFLLDEREVGADQTDDEGRASKECKLPTPQPAHFKARAVVDNRELSAIGVIYAWEKDRTIIAVDVDNTLSKTDYEDLILKEADEESDPVKGSRKVLARLADDYHLLYLTARPRFLLDKTRQWLRENKFPSGPVITAPSLRQALHTRTFKLRALQELRDDWPNLLIGIGDRPSDAAAYGANEMLTLIVSPARDREYGPHALILRDWKTIGRFFEVNKNVLTDPDHLREAIEGKAMLAQPVLPWREHD